MSEEALLPCPFCGNVGEVTSGRVWHYVRCTRCACGTSPAMSVEYVSRAWNNRAALSEGQAPEPRYCERCNTAEEIATECPVCYAPYGKQAQEPVAQEPAVWHELKTDPLVFQDVWDKRKRFEIRRDDRGFQIGDGLLLRETKHTGKEMAVGAPLVYTSRELREVVCYILRGPIYGLAAEWAILGLRESAGMDAARAKAIEADRYLQLLRDLYAGPQVGNAAYEAAKLDTGRLLRALATKGA